MVVTGAVVLRSSSPICWFDNQKKFAHTILDGITLAAEYFMVASGFTLVFGLMRQVNLAHGSLYLLGAYVGWSAADSTAPGISASSPGSSPWPWRACCCSS